MMPCRDDPARGPIKERGHLGKGPMSDAASVGGYRDCDKALSKLLQKINPTKRAKGFLGCYGRPPTYQLDQPPVRIREATSTPGVGARQPSAPARISGVVEEPGRMERDSLDVRAGEHFRDWAIHGNEDNSMPPVGDRVEGRGKA